MNFVIQNTDESDVRVKLEGVLDLSCQARLKENLHKLGFSNTQRRLVVDLSEVSFIDSACLGIFVSLIKLLKTSGSELFLISPQEEVRSVFQITRLDRLFTILDSSSELPEM